MSTRFFSTGRLIVLLLSLAILAGCQSTVERKENAAGMEARSPAEIYVRLAEAYYQSNVLDVALDKSLKAVDVDDEYAPAHAMLALVYRRIGDTAAANKHFAIAKKLAPNDPQVINTYGIFICEQGNVSGADAEFLKSAGLPLNSTPWVPLTNSGICFEQAGQLKSARERLNQALAKNPEFGRALSAAARVERRLGNHSKAKAYERKLAN